MGDAACRSSKDGEEDEAAEMAAARAARNADGSLRREGEAVADGEAPAPGWVVAAGGVAGRRTLFWALAAKVLRAGEEAAEGFAAAAKLALLKDDDDADLANPGGG